MHLFVESVPIKNIVNIIKFQKELNLYKLIMIMIFMYYLLLSI